MSLLSRGFAVLALAAFLSPTDPALAQKKNPWFPIKDDLDFFSLKAKEAADEQIAGLKKSHDKDLYIETMKSPEFPKTLDKADKAAVKKFFDDYAIRRCERLAVDGVYVVLFPDSQTLRAIVDKATQKAGKFTDENRDELVQRMIAKIKAKDNDGALAAATSYVVEKFGKASNDPIRDDVAFFSATAKEAALKQIAAIKKETGKDVVIEALKAPERPKNVDVKDKAAVEKYFAEFAQERFKKAKAEGVYVLIVPNPKMLFVLVDDKTKTSGDFTAENRDVLYRKILAALKENDPNGALSATTNFVAETIRANRKSAK